MDPEKKIRERNRKITNVAAIAAVLLVVGLIAILSFGSNVTIEKQNGAPVPAPNQAVTGAVVMERQCADSDATNIFIQGETSLGGISVKDSCHLSKVLEYYCGEKDGKEAILQKLVGCANGCNAGACNPSCSESDNGVNLPVRSILIGGNAAGEFAEIEKCRDPKTLIEYFCSGSEVVEREVSCSCKDGACK
ncbi:hypothetical protein HY638_02155 [Candidatus Woesearchaeota archaeon]|nr:hypothetical protein [Candidatus Woesearchaeota archaeon]